MEGDDSLYNLIHSVNENVKIQKGKDEYETYLNYPANNKSVLQTHIIDFFKNPGHKNLLNEKNDTKALELRNEGNKLFGKNTIKAREYFTLSLCKAVFGGEAYAIALANRSAASFALKFYTSCISDIELCLKAAYPDHLKPKVYIRKAKCYKELNQLLPLKLLLNDFKLLLDSLSAITADGDKYRSEIAELEKGLEDLPAHMIIQKLVSRLPAIDPNPKFLNASSSVSLQYKKSLGRHVVANELLQAGDVIFVEKAYMFITLYPEKGLCHFCYALVDCPLPCMQCSYLVFCTEKCRDNAWDDYHQWECDAIKTRVFSMFINGQLAMRTIYKASKTGFPTISTDFEADTISYGNKDDNYSYVHKMICHFDKLPNATILDLCATATLFICYVKTQTVFFKKLRENEAFSSCTDTEIENKLASVFMRHCEQLSCNITLMNVDNTHREEDLFAIGIFPSLSMMNHSCDSNIAYYLVNDVIVVKAAKTIGIGEQIFYNYKDNFIFPDRELEEVVYCFKCKCKYCTSRLYTQEALNSFACVKCKGSAIIDSYLPTQRNTCTCVECGFKFTLSASILANEQIIQNINGLFWKYVQSGIFPANFDDDLAKYYELMRTTYCRTHKLLSTYLLTAFDFYLTKKGGPDLNSLSNAIQNIRNYSILRNGNTSKKYALSEFDICKKLLDAILMQIHLKSVQASNLKELLLFSTKVFNESIMLKLWYPAFSDVFTKLLLEQKCL